MINLSVDLTNYKKASETTREIHERFLAKLGITNKDAGNTESKLLGTAVGSPSGAKWDSETDSSNDAFESAVGTPGGVKWGTDETNCANAGYEAASVIPKNGAEGSINLAEMCSSNSTGTGVACSGPGTSKHVRKNGVNRVRIRISLSDKVFNKRKIGKISKKSETKRMGEPIFET